MDPQGRPRVSATCCRTTPIPSRARWCCRRRSHHVGGNFNFEYVTANGGVASLTRTNAQRGINAAGPLLGAGLWWIRPGANVHAGVLAEVLRDLLAERLARDPKLTINLGLRYEIQPGPTERFNRMSAWDLEATNAFGTQGAIAFPGVDGYSRNLWDTTYDNFGPAGRRRLSD